MIDYERYDHTYCRVVKDGEEIRNLKQTPISPSYEVNSDVSNNHISSQPRVSIEKENGANNHEPVIIVRTKRPRKTAPIIVKAYNTGKEAVTTPAGQNAAEIKRKLMHPIIKINTEGKSSSADTVLKPGIVRLNQSEVSVPVTEMSSESGQTTKSGRTRKLTAKAKQNSENIKKAVKSPKVGKTNTDIKDAANKKPRGRPKKAKNEPVQKNSGDASEGITAGKTDENVIESSSETRSEKLPISDDANKRKFEVAVKPEQRKKAIKSSTTSNNDNKDKMLSSTAKSGASATQSQKQPTNKNPEPKLKSNPKSQTALKRNTKSSAGSKRSPKSARSKLVVITKPPPKRKARALKEAAETSVAETAKTPKKRKLAAAIDHSIPAAKIDASNIVGGSRRRK